MHPSLMSDAIDDCREHFAEVAAPRTTHSCCIGTTWLFGPHCESLARDPVPTLQNEISPHAPDLPWHVFSPRGGS